MRLARMSRIIPTMIRPIPEMNEALGIHQYTATDNLDKHQELARRVGRGEKSEDEQEDPNYDEREP